MKYKNFPVEFWDLLSNALEREQKSNRRPVAAFDADGTLWDTDLGEAFFKWQIQNSNLPDLPSDPWKFYRDWKASGDPRPAYLWLAQINQGQSIEQVRAWAEAAVNSQGDLPVFEEQRKLIQWLLERKVDIYVVTASVKWAVEPGVKRLGLKPEQVLGVQTQIEDDEVTDTQEGLITYREGKVEALLEATGGRKPFFASGNTMGDFALLSSATQLSLAVGAAPEDHELFATEENLRSEAKAKGWFIHKF